MANPATQNTPDTPAQLLRPPRLQSLFQIGLGAATATLLVGLVAAQLISRANQQRLLTALSDAHLRSLIAGHLVDVPSPEPATVQPWFEGKINFSPPVPNLTQAGYTLVGGRLDYLDGLPATALVYQLDKQYISVFLRPGNIDGPPAIQSLPAQRGCQIVAWQSGSLACRAVSEISDQNLRDFATAFRATAQNR